MACSSKIIAHYQNGVLHHATLQCSGTCPGEQPCLAQVSIDHHGGVRMWCGCTIIEPDDCHIAIYYKPPVTVDSLPEILCAGGCRDKGTICKPKTITLSSATGSDDDQTTVVRVRKEHSCACEALKRGDSAIDQPYPHE